MRRTRQQLGRALMELVLRKRYARITVQNILDQADVGRSTFYAHFRDKEDLLLGNFERMLAVVVRHSDSGMAGHDQALPQTLAFFRHAGDHHRLYRALSKGARQSSCSRGPTSS